MEDALAQKASCPHAPKHGGCLNPCCNGRCTRTENKLTSETIFNVLILVVMEDALAQ